jgi:hypothetical protein
MATVNPTFDALIEEQDRSIKKATWNLTTANNDGAPLELPSFAAQTWQAVGGPWGSATLSLEGSNDKVNWFPLTRIYPGNAATFTADGGVSTNENPQYVRPRLSTVGTGAAIAVTLVAVRSTPVRT